MFFRTNQTTCQEWVHRLCGAALTASVPAGRHASAVRYGLNILHHWAQQQRVVGTALNMNVDRRWCPSYES